MYAFKVQNKDFRSEAGYLLPLNIHKNDFSLLLLSKAVLWEDVMLKQVLIS